MQETNTWIFTGAPCRNGHIDKRYKNTGICYECKRQQVKRDYIKHKERAQKISQKTYQKNRVKHLAASQKWAELNRVQSNQIKKNYKVRHREVYLAYCRKYMKTKRLNPLYRLNKNFSKAIWNFLKDKKGYQHWESLVPYTLRELKTHLETQFKSGMTWENYGKYWEVDHIIPIDFFMKNDESFSQCWALENLRPLTCQENRSKGKKLISITF